RYHALELGGRDGELLGPQRVRVAPVRMQMERDEVHARADPAVTELGDERVAPLREPIEVQPQHVELPGRDAVGRDDGRLELGELGERGAVACRDGRPALSHLLYARELDAAERGRDVGEVV